MDFNGHENRTMNGSAQEEESPVRHQVLETLRTFGDGVFTYSGEETGVSMLIVGGTHGNEVLGVLMAGLIRRGLESGDIPLKAGTIRLALGNTRAIEANERSLPGGHDLNRILTPDVLEGREERGWEGQRARQIAEAIKASDIVIDLHSTNKPSPAFVCSDDSEGHRSIYKWLPREAVVVDPERIVSRGGGSVDEAADDFGKIGICYESGQATDASNLEPVFRALSAIMMEKGMIEGELPELPHPGDEYKVVEHIPYDENSPFEFAEGKDRGFAPIAKGEIIGYRGGEPISSPVNGIILFPKKPEHQASDGLVCYLAVKEGGETGAA